MWTIPAERMKVGREHRVPLSAPALAILHEMARLQDGSGLVFLGMTEGGQRCPTEHCSLSFTAWDAAI